MTASDRAESALIAALLIDPSRVPIVGGMLEQQHFGEPRLGRAFAMMVEMARTGKRIDAVTLAANGIDVQDVALHEHGVNVEDYANIIREGAFRRSIAGKLDRIQRAVDSQMPRNDIMAQISELSQDVARDTGKSKVYDVDRAVEAYRDIVKERRTRGVGLPYGIPQLDRWLQPAHGGDMVVVAARPSVGKTALAEHIIDTWAFESDLPVLFASIEMSLGQLMDRAVSRWGGVPSSHIVRGILSPDEQAMVDVALERRKSVNIWYLDDAYATTDSIRAAAAEVSIVSSGLRAIVVDYLQLLKDAGDNDNQRIGRISRNLKALAREHDCPILVLSQLNRQPEYREDQHPKLSDIRDSGTVEQDADVVLGLYRERYDEELSSYMDIDILKNRQGPLARATVEFDGDYIRFNTEEL